MKILRYLIVMSAICWLNGAYARQQGLTQLEKGTRSVIEKVYQACVRVYGYDSVRNLQNSAQFSAVVVSADGYMLTVAHAVMPGYYYKVSFPGGRQAYAVALGRIVTDQATTRPDVAMMKLIGDGPWPFAEPGWSYPLQKGQPCISISYPETLALLQPTIRTGFINNPMTQWGFVGSSCLMEPGDSGGPLFDYLGRVIALHSRVDAEISQSYEVPVDLYRKYWPALQRSVNYQTLPADSTGIGQDTNIAKTTAFALPEQIEEEAKNAVKSLVNSVVYIGAVGTGNEWKTVATLISTNGLKIAQRYRNGTFIIAKSSLTADRPVLQPGSADVPLEIIARDTVNDLALLFTSRPLANGLDISLTPGSPVLTQTGSLLVTPLPSGLFKTGVLSSTAFTLPRRFSSGYLGVSIGFNNNKTNVTRIARSSPAETCLKTGDEIISFNNRPVNSAKDYSELMQATWPGDQLDITIKRGDSVLMIPVRLAARPLLSSPNNQIEKYAGGPSVRRDGFTDVFAYDGKIHPDECGSPVFDTHGTFYGINIARFSRTANLAVTAEYIKRFIEQASR